MSASSRSLVRLSAVVCVALVGAALPGHVASAARPLVETSSAVSVPDCLISGTDGTTAYLNAFWMGAGKPFESALTVSVDGEPVATEAFEGRSLDWNGNVLSGYFPLDGVPETDDGSATFAVTFGPSGSSSTETVHTRLGNRTERQTITSQPLEATAGTVTVVLGERTWVFDATGCSGQQTTTVTVLSQPDTYVNREPLPDVRAVCEATNADGDVLYMDVNSHGGPNVVTEVYAGNGFLLGYAAVDWSGPPHPVTVTFEVIEFVGEDVVVVGTGSVDLTTRKTGQTSSTLVYQGGRDRLATTFYTVTGTVSFPGLAPFSITGCEGFIATALDRTSDPAGPPPGGPAPANDLPMGATELVVGAPAGNIRTGGAAPGPEEAFGCTVGYPQEYEPGRTVWFRFTGTGGALTLDPSGSSFNTVLAVYEERDGDLVEIGCLDDAGFGTQTPTLQAPLTVPTEEGVTYYVQAGGIAGEFGGLRLAAVAG